jgi:hypothetical protein
VGRRCSTQPRATAGRAAIAAAASSSSAQPAAAPAEREAHERLGDQHRALAAPLAQDVGLELAVAAQRDARRERRQVVDLVEGVGAAELGPAVGLDDGAERAELRVARRTACRRGAELRRAVATEEQLAAERQRQEEGDEEQQLPEQAEERGHRPAAALTSRPCRRRRRRRPWP